MTEHRGSSFAHSCVKVPLDPFSRQPTPSYERPRIQKLTTSDKNRKINFLSSQVPSQSSRHHNSSQDSNRLQSETASSDDSINLETFIDFIDSIPDYGQVNHLSNEQFKQKLDYLKRKQRLLLKNLKNCLDNDDEKSQIIDNKSPILFPTISTPSIPDKSSKQWDNANSDLKLFGKKCYLEDSRADSPWLYSSGTFAGLAEDQDLLTYR